MHSELLLDILQSAQAVAEQAEVFSVASRTMPVQFEANRLKQVQTKERSSVAVRIVREGRIGFASASGGSKLDTLVDMAVETAQFGDAAGFEFPSPRGYPEVRVFDSAVAETATEAMIEMGGEIITRVTKCAPGVVCDLEVTKGVSSVSVVNSQGGEGAYERSGFSLSVEGVAVRDTDILFVGDSQSWCRMQDADGLADSVIRQLEMAKETAVVSARVLPVILTPLGVASVLLSPLALAFSGRTVLEGASPLRGRLGEQVFDKALSLWDDATIDYGAASYPFDDEGVPGRRLPLVDKGVVTGFFLDLRTAALLGTESTGNGSRVSGGAPVPALSSLIVGEGDMSFRAMVEDMKEGLIVEHVIGAGQGNLLGGDFGGNVLLGYKVENGEIVGRVKDTMIAGNVFEVLGELCGIGREARWVEGALHTPALYCPRISVATKGS